MASAAENHMAPRHLQKILDERLITNVQICLRCGRKLPFKRGRKRCPSCQGLLRIKTMILKVP